MHLYICCFSLCEFCCVRDIIQRKLLNSFIFKSGVYGLFNTPKVGARISFVYV